MKRRMILPPRWSHRSFMFLQAVPSGTGSRARVVSTRLPGLVSCTTTTENIVTNAHVVASADEIEVQFANGEKRLARFVGSDVRSDIAVVRGCARTPAPRGEIDDIAEQGRPRVRLRFPVRFQVLDVLRHCLRAEPLCGTRGTRS